MFIPPLFSNADPLRRGSPRTGRIRKRLRLQTIQLQAGSSVIEGKAGVTHAGLPFLARGHVVATSANHLTTTRAASARRCCDNEKRRETVYLAGDDIKRLIMLLYEIFCEEEGQERKNPELGAKVWRTQWVDQLNLWRSGRHLQVGRSRMVACASAGHRGPDVDARSRDVDVWSPRTKVPDRASVSR